MKQFIIERKLPGAGNLSDQELIDISKTSLAGVVTLGKPYTWIQSYVTEDAIICVHEAEEANVIEEHSAICHFPINVVREVKRVFGPATAKG
jgi:hypothetical protein